MRRRAVHHSDLCVNARFDILAEILAGYFHRVKTAI